MSVRPPPPPPYGPHGPHGPHGPYGYAREHPDGTTVLVLGILSLAVCGLLGPFAWAKGNTVLAEIDRAPYAYTNRSSVVTGRICGMVATGLLVVSALIFFIVLVGAVSAST